MFFDATIELLVSNNMLLNSKPYTFDRVFRLLAGIIIAGGGIWLLNRLSDVLIPFATAFLLAYLLNPLVNLVQRRIRYRAVAVFAALALVFVFVVLAALLITPQIKNEVVQMSVLISRVAQDADLTQNAVRYLPAGLNSFADIKA